MVSKIPTCLVESWDGLLSALSQFDDGNWGFRGVTSKEHDLVPSIGRKTARKRYSREWEKEIFYKFKQQAFPYLTKIPANEFAWLAIARHSGLPTRLLDWTLSPLVAVYFAVTGPRPESGDPPDCALYAFWSKEYEDDDEIKTLFGKGKNHRVVDAGHYIARIATQKGFFTLHHQPNKPFRTKTLRKFVIPGRLCNEFQEKLDFYGLNHATLFPDLDGLGRYWAWCYQILS
jgi:FRG domain